jgi:hypothetical protein
VSGEKARELLESSDVQYALQDIAARVAVGLPGLVLCRGPGGFALVAGVAGKAMVRDVGAGHMIALSLNVAGLDALIQRACELRCNQDRQGDLPESIVQ